MTPLILAVLGVLILPEARLAAQPMAPPGGQAHSHEGHEGGPYSDRGYSFTLNVTISDAGVEPSTVFVPAGRRVQLVLRNRGVSEHHYRVVGLVPDDVLWISEPGSGVTEGVTEEGLSNGDHHSHHARDFVPWRAASPAGISPTGREVHAYVSPLKGVDVVLFTATNSGTFVVRCDLHGDIVGKMTVFDSGRQPVAPAPPSGRQTLARALTRDLGLVDHAGASGVHVEATYAPAEYVSQVLGPASMAVLEPDRHVAVLVTERIDAGHLPDAMEPPGLAVDGRPLRLVDWRVMTDSPRHRSTSYRFARHDAFGEGDQVMALRLASGQRATWHLPVILPPVETGPAGPSGVRMLIFVLGFALALTATGTLVGFAAQRFR